jgi:aminoglycoside phosphotransferase (APT) family kinase protein
MERPQLGANGLEQELAHWRSYFRQAAGGHTHPVMEEGLGWLTANLPPQPVTGLAWGDSRIGNVIFVDFRCVSILDWDMASLAGGEIDLGWWIVQNNDTPRHLDGMGTPLETVELWEDLTGRRASDLFYHLVLNAFRLGAIRIRLARGLAGLGALSADSEALEHNNTGIQQVALLLDFTPPGRVTTTPLVLDGLTGR